MILCADFVKLARDLSFFEGIDVQIVDTPYSDYVHTHTVSNHSAGAGPSERDLGFESLDSELRRAVAIAAASVQRWTVVFSDLESTHLWRDEMARLSVQYVREVQWPDGVVDPVPARWIRWSQPQNSGDRPPMGAEATLVFHRMSGGKNPRPIKKRWNGPGNLTHWPQKSLRGDEKYDAEKSLDLMLAIVSAFSDPGEVVLDGACGVGTTHRACDLLERECVAVEVLPDVAARAERRIASSLTNRERERCERFCEWAFDYADAVPFAEPGAIGRAAWERAQRQLADVGRVARRL